MQTKILTTTKPSKTFAIIITAAGSSTRMGGTKKEFLPLKNGTVLSNCALTFLNAFKQNKLSQKDTTAPQSESVLLSDIVITIPEGTERQAEEALFSGNEISKQDLPKFHFVTGDSTRQKSVFRALQFLNDSSAPDYVLIHDGARPFVSPATIKKVISATIEFGAAAPGFTPTDTIKQIDQDGFILNHLTRKDLICIQTPQGFSFSKLFDAHQNACKTELEFTDDSEIWGKFCGKVKIVDGDISNIKITYQGDLEKALQRGKK